MWGEGCQLYFVLPVSSSFPGSWENEVSWLGTASFRGKRIHCDHDGTAEIEAVQQSLVAGRTSNLVHQRTVHEDLKKRSAFRHSLLRFRRILRNYV
jgi:hypothetical protein